MTPFGNLKRFRLEKGLTQEQLAEKVGLSQGMIWKIENGEGLPSLRSAMRIADALDTTVDRLSANLESEIA